MTQNNATQKLGGVKATALVAAFCLSGGAQGKPGAQDQVRQAATESTCEVPPRPYVLGTPLDADLKAPDGFLSQATPFVVFQTTLESDTQLSIVAAGDKTFLPVVAVGRCEAGAFTRLAVGSVSSVTLAEALTRPVETGLTIREAGAYLIRITGADQRVGRVTLLAEKVTLQAKPQITELTVNAVLTDQLTTNSNRRVFADTHYNLYRLKSTTSTRALVLLVAKKGKPSIATGSYVEDPWQDYFVVPQSTRPSTRISLVLPADGERFFRVAAPLNDDAQYDLKVELAPAPQPPPVPDRVAFGQTVQGKLVFNDPAIVQRLPGTSNVSAGFKRYRLYALSGNPGDRATLTLRSSEFDPLLQIVAPTVLEERLSTIVSNDDHGSGDKTLDRTDARLDVEFKAKGELLIRATSAIDAQYGAFTLSIEPTPPPTESQSPGSSISPRR